MKEMHKKLFDEGILFIPNTMNINDFYGQGIDPSDFESVYSAISSHLKNEYEKDKDNKAFNLSSYCGDMNTLENMLTHLKIERPNGSIVAPESPYLLKKNDLDKINELKEQIKKPSTMNKDTKKETNNMGENITSNDSTGKNTKINNYSNRSENTWCIPMAGFAKKDISIKFESGVIIVDAVMSNAYAELFDEKYRKVHDELYIGYKPSFIKAQLGTDNILCVVFGEPENDVFKIKVD